MSPTNPTNTTTPSPGYAPLIHPREIRPVDRTPGEHEALRGLLAAARHAETTAMGADRRPAHRVTRSLLAAARVLGFTLQDLAELTGVTVGSVRTRSGVLDPVPRARFLALLPEHAGTEPPPAAADGADSAEDPVQLLTWYLSAVFVAGDRAAS